MRGSSDEARAGQAGVIYRSRESEIGDPHALT